MDKRLENRKLMENFQQKLNEGFDVKYYQRGVDKIINELEELLFELHHDEDLREPYPKFTQVHIDNAITSLEKLTKTLRKV